MPTQSPSRRGRPLTRPYKPTNALRAIREHHGLTLMQMAEIAGTSFQHLSGAELGKWELRAETLCKISNHFGYTVQQIRDPAFNPKKFSQEFQEKP